MMQGVAYSEPLNVDAFFVTLKKSEADYSPTTMYRDYPISPTLFHWESQNATSVASPTGQRYLNGSSTVLLFCRIEHKGEYDTAPYVFLGPASYVSHEGERPIAITGNRSVISGRTVFTGAPCVAGYVAVLPCSLPTSLGGDAGGIPAWAAWLLDQVEGFVWPGRRHVPPARGCFGLARRLLPGGRPVGVLLDGDPLLRSLRSPELPIATEVTESLAARRRAVADQCAVVARACETVADHVESQREEILDLVHDLLRDAVIIEGIGIVLGAFTVGTSAAGASALNAARIAAAAPRFLRILEALRSLAATCAAPLRLAAGALRDLRASLAVFRDVRVTLASTRRRTAGARGPAAGDRAHSAAFRRQRPSGAQPETGRELLDDWPVKPSRSGEGIVYADPFTVTDRSA